MSDNSLNIAGIRIPSDSPYFLAIVGIHVLAALICVIYGLVAMLSNKSPGRHPKAGTIYYRALFVVFISATMLAIIRWEEDRILFGLGVAAFACASIGRSARRNLWKNWVYVHVSFMGLSYIIMLTAFYVDNGKSLPLWRDLPSIAYWIIPAAVGIPIIVYVLCTHPLVKKSS